MQKRNHHSRSAPPDGKTMKEKLTELTEKLEQGVSEIFTSENYTNWLRTMSRFHHYSIGNTILIALQAPYASQVASYSTWKKLHRHVRKGEKGIKILVPAPVKVKEEKQKFDPDTAQPLFDTNGNPLTETEEHLIQHYKIGHVFAYEQTEGEPLPQLGPDELTGDAKNFDVMKQAVISIAPVPVRFDEIDGGAKGYFSSTDKEIVVKKGMSEIQTLKTLFHELAHSLCHDQDTMHAQGIVKDRQTKEVEAESCAWICLNFFKIDTSDYSFPYISGWSSGRDMKELRSSMEFIRETSGMIIDSVTEKMQELGMDVQPFSVLEALEKNRELAAMTLLEENPEKYLAAEELRVSDKAGIAL